MLAPPIGILGFGVEGQSTLKFLQSKGITDIEIFDQKNGENYLENLHKCKTIIRSAGVYPLQKEILNAQLKGATLTSQAELFFDMVPHSQIIGVTGTLGKGTCVSMIAHCLEAANVPHVVGGNYGIPMLDLQVEKNTLVVLELSSFQLMTLGASPHIAVVLQTTSEHLDWHPTLEQYRDAKANLVRWQKRDDYCVYCAESEGATQIAMQSGGIKKTFDGKYQLQNTNAATVVLECLGFNAAALQTYKGLPMRLQNIGTKKVKNKTLTFYNDSYATRPEATIAASASMTAPFTLILGGSEKHADFTELANELAKNSLLKGIALIGATAERLRNEICKGKPTWLPLQIFENLNAAFEWCIENTPDNGAVLLSPACASFGLFANYKERGNQFNCLVSTLSV